jgi:hypothetical protein
MEGEGAHGGGSQRQSEQIHGVGAEVRGQGNGLAAPLDDAGADFFDFHLNDQDCQPSLTAVIQDSGGLHCNFNIWVLGTNEKLTRSKVGQIRDDKYPSQYR